MWPQHSDPRRLRDLAGELLFRALRHGGDGSLEAARVVCHHLDDRLAVRDVQGGRDPRRQRRLALAALVAALERLAALPRVAAPEDDLADTVGAAGAVRIAISGGACRPPA